MLSNLYFTLFTVCFVCLLANELHSKTIAGEVERESVTGAVQKANSLHLLNN